MTIRPIDLQTMMPKTTEVSKLQHLQKENFDTQKSILALGFQVQLRASRQKVNQRNKAEDIKIEKEQQKADEYNDKNKKHNRKQSKSKEQKKPPYVKNTSRYIDIKV